MTILSGYILARPATAPSSRHRISREDLATSVETVDGEFSLRFDHVLSLGDYWESFEFSSSVPLPTEEKDFGQVHSCSVIVCRSVSRMLFLTERKRITDFIIEKLLAASVYPNFRKVPIAIDKFIDACSEIESPYAVTSMHGRFAGNERAVRTMILFGEEITDSSVFRQHGNLFNFYNAGVKRRTQDRPSKNMKYDDQEIARVGNDGQISTNLRDRERANDVLGMVKYIFDNGWAWVDGGSE